MLEKKQDMFSRLLIFGVILCFSFNFISCKNDKATEESVSEIVIDKEVEEVVLDGEFVKFYNEFHKDSMFQLDHIAFPLQNNHDESIGEFWNRENWVRHNTFTDMDGMFRRDFEVLGNIVIEKIIDANGFFEMERRFANLSAGWNLIFYTVENPSINNQE